MDVIQQDGNEIRAEIIRSNYLFTNEEDNNVRFYNYLLHNKNEMLGFKDLRWYWMQGEDSRHLGYNKPLEKHMKSGGIWSFFMSGPITFAMFQYSLPELSFSRKFAPAFGFGLIMGVNGYFKSYELWQNTISNYGKKYRLGNEDLYNDFLKEEEEFFANKVKSLNPKE